MLPFFVHMVGTTWSVPHGRYHTTCRYFLIDWHFMIPTQVSLVNKDASMLEAFGKGASEDIENAKDLIYTAMTYDPETPSGTSPASLTPPGSPHMVGPPRGGMFVVKEWPLILQSAMQAHYKPLTHPPPLPCHMRSEAPPPDGGCRCRCCSCCRCCHCPRARLLAAGRRYRGPAGPSV